MTEKKEESMAAAKGLEKEKIPRRFDYRELFKALFGAEEKPAFGQIEKAVLSQESINYCGRLMGQEEWQNIFIGELNESGYSDLPKEALSLLSDEDRGVWVLIKCLESYYKEVMQNANGPEADAHREKMERLYMNFLKFYGGAPVKEQNESEVVRSRKSYAGYLKNKKAFIFHNF